MAFRISNGDWSQRSGVVGIGPGRLLTGAHTKRARHQQAVDVPLVSLVTFGVVNNRRCSEVRISALLAHWVCLTGNAPTAIENVNYAVTGGGGRAIGVLKGQHEVVGVVSELGKPIAHVRCLAEIAVGVVEE